MALPEEMGKRLVGLDLNVALSSAAPPGMKAFYPGQKFFGSMSLFPDARDVFIGFRQGLSLIHI